MADTGTSEGTGTPEPNEPETTKKTAGDDQASWAAPVDVHPPTWLERIAYTVVWVVTFAWAKLWVRLQIEGQEKLPADRPFVLAPVHRSNLDFLLVAFPTRRRMRFMGKASLWKVKPLGRFVTMLGAFPVNRGAADRAAMRTCMNVIEHGEPVVMFPEGTRRSGPEVSEVFDGPAYVAARASVPLVPVGIGGSDEAMPIGARWIRFRKVALVVGDPIHPPQGEGTGRVPRRVVREMTEQLRKEVQALYDEAQRLAG